MLWNKPKILSSALRKGFTLLVFLTPLLCVNAQTIVAPRLTCVVNDFGGGNVDITWQNNANACGAFVSYTIYGSNSISGPYSVIATITSQTQTTYTHVGAAAQTWYYYMEADFSCGGGATILHSDTIRNESNPQTPVIIMADVDENDNVTFSWQPSTSPQTKYYIIYAVLPNGGLVPMDTVAGRNNTSYYDVIQDPTIQSVCYTVSAGDSCVGNQPSAYNTGTHCSMYLTAVVSQCSRQVTLSWNSYYNMAGGVKEYQIIVNKNLAGFEVVDVVDTTQTQYNYTNFNDGDSVIISIVAVSEADTNVKAHSNYVRLRPAIVQPPRFLHIVRASVTPNNDVEVNYISDSTAELLNYGITKSADCSYYELVEFTSVPVPLTFANLYIDSTANADETALCYKTIAVDSCQARDTSDYARTINLQGELTDYYEVNLVWNDYEITGGTVSRYTLYRNYGNGWQAIKQWAPGMNTVKDSVYQFMEEKGFFCYYILAEYSMNLPDVPYTANLTSTSNVFCVYHRPIIYIPNAFAPNGVNNIFKPTIIYGDPTNYSMQIYNRYGGKIFESNSPDVGWDGMQNGTPAQQGGYAYLIKFTAADGTPIERKGIVILIRS